jgi:acid phosphatase type 7
MKNLLLLIFLSFNGHAATKIIVLSDFNGSYGSNKYDIATSHTLDYIANDKPDLVISTGDMIAGQKNGLNYQKMWDAFHETVTIPLLNLKIPFAVTPGNHDASGYVTFKNEREIFKQQKIWYKQQLMFVDKTHYPLRYAFVLKDILFIALDATVVGPLAIDQMKWLKNLLHQYSHFKTKIAFGHLPIFPVAQNRENEHIYDLDLVNLFQTYQISLYLAGHHHAYYPGYCEGLYQVVQSCLGGGARRLIGDDKLAQKSFTQIIIDDNGRIHIQALTATIAPQIIDKKTLPTKILYKQFEVMRDDLID